MIFTDSRRVWTYISSDVASPKRCGNEALLKTSWTQLNPGSRFFTCRISKKMGGCDYFLWYEDRHPPQANRVMWGLLK
ncbi:hypothetical protein KY284_032829 [Solanum tuberosum]|nr:hypothetical protein KY284_032829 [Solanum tuberosum]